MRVVLINPAFNRYGGLEGHGGKQIPISLCYLAAYARREHPDIEFKIIDSDVRGITHAQTMAEAKAFSPDLIGITANTCVFDSVIDLIGFLREGVPGVPIIIGGSHPTALPARAMDESGADFIALREAELSFSNLLGQLKSGDGDYAKINGIGYRGGDGELRFTPPRELIADLDDIPFPARDLVDNDIYAAAPTKRVSAEPNTMIVGGRGCPYMCGFCSVQTIFTRKIRYRKPKLVIDEMEECISRYGISSFAFTDEIFTSHKKRVKELCAEIVKRKIDVSWNCFARAHNLDRETLEAMRDAGCRKISFGIESGNLEVLGNIDKTLDLEEAERVVRLTKKVGIPTHASYILGYLGESEASMKDTIRFAKKLNTEIAAFFIASPLPGTRFYREALEQGHLDEKAPWINYSPLSNHPSVYAAPGLSMETIRKWHRYAIRSYYLRPRYILSRLFGIRHWYDVKNILGGIKFFFNIKS